MWAWAAFPRPMDPESVEPIYVSFESKRSVEAVTANVERYEPFEGSQSAEPMPAFRVTIRADSPEVSGDTQAIAWVVLNDTIVAPGISLDCSSDCEYSNETGLGISQLRFRVKLPGRWEKDEETGGSTFHETASIPDGLSSGPYDGTVLSMPGLSCTPERCTGFVPSVTVTRGTPLEPNATALVGVSKGAVDLYDYTWQASVPVAKNTGTGPDLRFSYPLEESPEIGFSEQHRLEGTSSRVQRQNEVSLFLAGALVGVSGGALIGALQESLRPKA